MRCRIVLIFMLAVVIGACDQLFMRDSRNIEGVWQIEEIVSQNNGDFFTGDSIPSIFIFTPRHYSMVWVLNEEQQRGFEERWNPTDKEKINRFDSFVVNSGIYNITKSHLTAHPIVARVPEFMGGRLECKYKLRKDTLQLILVDEYSYDGVQAPWVSSGSELTLTLIRIDR